MFISDFEKNITKLSPIGMRNTWTEAQVFTCITILATAGTMEHKIINIFEYSSDSVLGTELFKHNYFLE